MKPILPALVSLLRRGWVGDRTRAVRTVCIEKPRLRTSTRPRLTSDKKSPKRTFSIIARGDADDPPV